MSNTDIKPSAREFVHATYVRSKNSDTDDLLVVKEKLHFPDKHIENNIRFIPNYERDFYVTQKQYQDHEQKKEFEYIHKCDRYTCTQAQLVKKAARILKDFSARTISQVNASPFIYGTDITTPVLLHQEYNKQWPELCTDSTLAVMDYETDVVHNTGDIISGSITFKDRACLAVTKSFLEKYLSDATERITEAFVYYLNDYIKARNISLEIIYVETPAKVVTALFKRAHDWQPDFLGFWNMSFDINRILEALESSNIPPEEVFCDPSIPRDYKKFSWREDSLIKRTADGKQTSKHVADLWHSVTAPASFACIDLMCLFKRLRVREKQRTSYSLDAILGDELNLSKLKFKEADGLVGLDWHYKMQSEHPIEYLIYNLFDCISVELLDEKNGDASRALRPNVDISEIARFNSNPKRLSDAMYFILQDEGKIIGSVSENLTEDLDELTFSKNRWMNNVPQSSNRLMKRYLIVWKSLRALLPLRVERQSHGLKIIEIG